MMSYSDLWTNNLRCQLPKLAAECSADKKGKLLPPKWYTTAGGNAVFPKARWNQVVPERISHLDLSGNEFDEAFGAIRVPSHVKWLDVSKTNYLDGMIHVREGVETIICKGSGFSWGGYVPRLPRGLKILDLSGQNIDGLPKLPETLEVLILRGCDGLRSLPRLPPTLRVLDVACCKNLKTLPEDIPESVKEIWVEGSPKLPQWVRDHSGSYWDLPKVARQRQEEASRLRQQKRARDLKLEIIAEVYKPARVEKWLEQCGWDILDMMF